MQTRRTTLDQISLIQKLAWPFGNSHLDKEDFWSSVLWTDETLIELFGYNDLAFNWSKKGEGFTPNNTIFTVKRDNRNLLLWWCFSAEETGNLITVNSII